MIPTFTNNKISFCVKKNRGGLINNSILYDFSPTSLDIATAVQHSFPSMDIYMIAISDCGKYGKVIKKLSDKDIKASKIIF